MTGSGCARLGRWPLAAGLLLLLSATAGRPASDAASTAERGFLGVLLPQQAVDLAPLVEGRLQSVAVRIGDRLGQGAIIAELDATPIRRERDESAARLEEARAEEAEAVTRVGMAQEALERRRALVATGVVSAEQVREAEREAELAQAVLDRSRARVQQQRAALEQMEARVTHTKLLAPFSGLVAERYADPGMSVGPGTPVVRLISNAGLWVRFAVPVDEAGDVRVGEMMRVSVPGAGLEMTAKIVQAGSAVDEASGMIFYEGVVEQPAGWNGPPLAGQTVRLRPASRVP